MRRPLALALLATLIPAMAPAAGQGTPPMTAEDFEAYVTGKTLTYSQYGQTFGTEEYLPGRKVRWMVARDECQFGEWYPKDEMICFTYEYQPGEWCWTFWREGAGLVALSVTDAPGDELNEVSQTTDGLPCPGPLVGV